MRMVGWGQWPGVVGCGARQAGRYLCKGSGEGYIERYILRSASVIYLVVDDG